MENAFVGRQAIYDRELNVAAYELLFRQEDTPQANVTDGDQATSQVMINTFMEMGLDQVVGGHRAFINLTRNFLVGNIQIPFPRERLVLEVLEDILVDQELIDGIRKLSKKGFTIALDDFIFHESLLPLVELADIIKIDLPLLTQDELVVHVDTLRKFPVKLLAEKVETRQEYEFCRQLGFDYFQGYFLCRPNIVRGQRLPGNRLATLRLLSRLQDPNVQASELEALISQDVSMSYKLLRYINSAFFALPRKIESISQAVVYVGLKTIKSWVSLIALSKVEDKPLELMTTAMVRGKLCELLAHSVKAKNKEIFFTVGLFSTLDAMMDLPLEEILDSLPLADEVSSALLQHTGLQGQALKCVLANERGDYANVQFGGLQPGEFSTLYMEAIRWADQSTMELVA